MKNPAVGRATEVFDFCHGKSSLWKLSRRDKAIVENRWSLIMMVAH